MAKWWLKCFERELWSGISRAKVYGIYQEGLEKYFTFGLVKSLIKPQQACSESQKCNKADISDSLNHFLNLLALCCGWFLHKFSTNNSETTSNIVSQIRACDKQDCFMSLLLISVFILMVRNFDFCMLRDGGKNSSLSVKWSCFLAQCSFEAVWMQTNRSSHSLILGYIT